MVLEFESEYFWHEFFDDGEFELAPFKKEVCLGIVCLDESIGDVLADNFCDIGFELFEKRIENPTKPFYSFKVEDDENYISFFFYINEAEIMNYSIPMEFDEENLLEKLKPVFKNFWETHFEKIMEVRRYNRGIMEKIEKKNTANAAGMLYHYYCRIEMNPVEKFFWLKKWASRCSMGKRSLLKYYRKHHENGKAIKLERLIRGDRDSNF